MMLLPDRRQRRMGDDRRVTTRYNETDVNIPSCVGEVGNQGNWCDFGPRDVSGWHRDQRKQSRKTETCTSVRLSADQESRVVSTTQR